MHDFSSNLPCLELERWKYTVLIPALISKFYQDNWLLQCPFHYTFSLHIFSLSNFGGGIFGAAAKAASKGLDAADALADKVRMIRNALKTVFGKHINVRVWSAHVDPLSRTARRESISTFYRLCYAQITMFSCSISINPSYFFPCCSSSE